MLKTYLALSVFLVLTILFNPEVFADEKAEDSSQEWSQFAKPGAHHKELSALAGKWKAVTSFWSGPGIEPTVSQGTCEYKVILGGRFVQQDFQSTFMGRPFAGVGYLGYDNYRQHYVSMWMDSMTTFIMSSTGKADASGKIITFNGQYDDPMSKQTRKFRGITTFASKDKHVYQMFETGSDGKEQKSLEIVYTRI